MTEIYAPKSEIKVPTFCSRVVISCSAFESLNLKSLICLLASPIKTKTELKNLKTAVGNVNQMFVEASFDSSFDYQRGGFRVSILKERTGIA